MINAASELKDHIKHSAPGCKVEYVHIEREHVYPRRKEIIYSGPDPDQALAVLNFTYDDGFGTQELFGTVWFDDGTWSERDEYDGSEWWTRRIRPPIPIQPCAPAASASQS